MICIGKTYRLNPKCDIKNFKNESGYIREKDLNYFKTGVVIMGVSEVPGSKWGKAFYLLPSTIVFPTPEPEKGDGRFKEEFIMFENELMRYFEPMYIKEEVEEAVTAARKFLESVMHNRTKNGSTLSIENFPEIKCRNCGRSVYVGKCCDNPDIEIKE